MGFMGHARVGEGRSAALRAWKQVKCSFETNGLTGLSGARRDTISAAFEGRARGYRAAPVRAALPLRATPLRWSAIAKHLPGRTGEMLRGAD